MILFMAFLLQFNVWVSKVDHGFATAFGQPGELVCAAPGVVDIAEQKVAAVDHPLVSPLNGKFGMALDFRVHGVRQIVVFVFLRREIGENHANPDVRVYLPELLQAGVHCTVKLPLIANIKSVHTFADQIFDCIHEHLLVQTVTLPVPEKGTNFHIIASFFQHYTTKISISTASCTNFAHLLPIIMVQLQGSVVLRMLLNEAVSKRIVELLKERDMTNYQLYIKSGVPKSTIGNLVNCTYDSVKLRVIHEVCQGFGISITEFFDSPLFAEDNLEP